MKHRGLTFDTEFPSKSVNTTPHHALLNTPETGKAELGVFCNQPAAGDGENLNCSLSRENTATRLCGTGTAEQPFWKPPH